MEGDPDDEVRVSRSLYATVTTTMATSHEYGDSIELTAALGNNAQNSHATNNGTINGTCTTATGSTARTTNNRTTSSISFTELSYGISSYHVIVTPVTLTMILSAVVVTNVTSTQIDTSSSINTMYNAFQTSDDYGVGTNLGLSVLNALVIVAVVAAATFGLVLLYKYRCMKFLFGYMVLSSAALLGLLGSLLFIVAIDKYNIQIDQITFYIFLVNFAIVGTMSIFFSNGIPTYITQSYLVITSVILAWQLSQFNDWTAWCLLIALALYDLCAVLTPCGPLKALIKLMSKDNAPALPGLLYEAQLPQGVERPSASAGNHMSRNSSNGKRTTTSSSSNNNNCQPINNANEEEDTSSNNNANHCHHNNVHQLTQPQPHNSSNHNIHNIVTATASRTTGTIPLALALIYKLPIQSPSQYATTQNNNNVIRDRSQYNASQLTSNVVVLFPMNGGYIKSEIQEGQSNEEVEESTSSSSSKKSWSLLSKTKRKKKKYSEKYIVYDRHQNVKRVLIVNQENGRVFEEVKDDANGGDGGGVRSSNSIKLGLGDFIFYSVLVSKAAQYSFMTFSACMLVILAGLGGTLVLLSVFHTALPALPISIFLGVIFYFVTRTLIEPYLVEALLITPVYV